MTAVCPVCGSDFEEPFLRRPDVPVHQNMLIADRADARDTVRGDLELAHCPRCDFVSNVAFDSDLMRYGANYENSQISSPTFARHVDALVEDLAATTDLRTKRVIEVGCGNGYFLRQLHARSGCTALGFDPSYRGPAEESGGRLRFVRDYYSPLYADEPADLVVCRHVIEHVVDPLGLLRSIRTALWKSPGARVAFETPAIEWILEGVVYQDFFYEHCSYFSEASIATALQRAGFRPLRVARVFGGQYLWAEAAVDVVDSAPPEGDGLSALIRSYLSEEAQRLAATARTLERLADTGGAAVWGAGAKGTTFVNLLDPEARRIDCVVDINTEKQGKFVAGTGHPIVSPESLVTRPVRAAIVMNGNYLEECRQIATEHRLDLELLAEG